MPPRNSTDIVAAGGTVGTGDKGGVSNAIHCGYSPRLRHTTVDLLCCFVSCACVSVCLPLSLALELLFLPPYQHNNNTPKQNKTKHTYTHTYTNIEKSYGIVEKQQLLHTRTLRSPTTFVDDTRKKRKKKRKITTVNNRLLHQ